MASEVNICNLALAHLGDSATVASINPPEGSAQAEHCQKFYPIARDTLLEMHEWSFTSKRITAAQLTNSWPMWKYAYAYPSDAIDILSVLPPEAENDYSTAFRPSDAMSGFQYYAPLVAAGMYMPQQFAVETSATGQDIIYTNQENAVLRYKAYVTDTTKFSPLFVLTLSWHLASMLAGPVLKGDVGAAEGKRCASMMAAFLAQAVAADSAVRNIKPEHIVPWVSGR
jgi:hypothetical protein